MKKFLGVFLMMSILSSSAFANVVVDLPIMPDYPNPGVSFPGVFVAHDEPRQEIDQQCGTIVVVKLDEGSVLGKVAVLEERVTGLCDLYVMPNKRIYELSQTTTSCGSVLYSATRETNEGVVKFELADHRSRVCRDLQPATLVIKETQPNGFERDLYADPSVNF